MIDIILDLKTSRSNLSELGKVNLLPFIRVVLTKVWKRDNKMMKNLVKCISFLADWDWDCWNRPKLRKMK